MALGSCRIKVRIKVKEDLWPFVDEKDRQRC